MRWLPVGKPKCGCDADRTETSFVFEAIRGRPAKRRRGRMIRHWRERDDAHFWHWSDTKVVRI